MSDSKPENSPSKQSVLGLNGLVFFLSDVRHGIGPLITIYLKTVLQWDPGKIGLALAMPDIAALFFQIPAGMVADETRYKRTFIALPCISVILASLFILGSPYFLVIFVAQFLMGIAISFISPLLGAVTLGLFGKERFPKRTSLNEVFNHAGNVSSAVLAGVTGYYFGSQWVFYWVISFAICTLFFLSFIRSQEINYRVARELPTDEFKLITPISDLVKRKSIVLFNLFLVIYYIANGSQMVLVGQKISTLYPQQSSLFIAGCMLAAELTMIAISFAMGSAIYRFKRKTLFLTAFLLLPIRALLFSVIVNPIHLIGVQTLDGIAAGIVAVTIPVINTDLGFQTGRFNFLQGVSALSISLGVVISMIFGGNMANLFGFHTTFITLCLIGVLGFLATLLFMNETKNSSNS